MAQVIDLDVFLPEKKEISFTAIGGHEIKRRVEELQVKQSAAKSGIVKWIIGIRINDLRGKLRTHVHKFDITNMSFKAMAFILAHQAEFATLSTATASTIGENEYKLVLGVIEEIAIESDPALTVDYLMHSMYFEQIVKLMEFALGAVSSFIQSNPTGAAGEQAGPSE